MSVTIVFGPPCAGKNFHVAANSKAGDVLIDYDYIMSALTGRPLHDGLEAAHWLTFEAVGALVSAISRDGYEHGRAWILGSFMDPSKLVRTQRSIRGSVIVRVDPGIDICLERAVNRPDPESTMAAVRKWYALHGLQAKLAVG